MSRNEEIMRARGEHLREGKEPMRYPLFKDFRLNREPRPAGATLKRVDVYHHRAGEKA